MEAGLCTCAPPWVSRHPGMAIVSRVLYDSVSVAAAIPPRSMALYMCCFSLVFIIVPGHGSTLWRAVLQWRVCVPFYPSPSLRLLSCVPLRCCVLLYCAHSLPQLGGGVWAAMPLRGDDFSFLPFSRNTHTHTHVHVHVYAHGYAYSERLVRSLSGVCACLSLPWRLSFSHAFARCVAALPPVATVPSTLLFAAYVGRCAMHLCATLSPTAHTIHVA